MNTNKLSYLSIIQNIGVITLLHLSYILAFLLKFDFELPSYNFDSYLESAIYVTIVSVIIFYFFDLLTNAKRVTFEEIIVNLALALLSTNIMLIVISFWIRAFSFPRSIIIISALIQFVAIGLYYYAIWCIEKVKLGNRIVCVIEDCYESAKYIAEKLHNHSKGWYEIGQVVTVKSNFINTIKWDSIQTVVMGSSLSQNEKEQIIYASIKHNKEIMVVPQTNELLLSNYKVERIDDMMVYNIKTNTLVNYQKFFKRLMDIVLSLIILTITAPTLLFLYVYIPINSKGKAIYAQERVGLNGSKFNILKFRSMFIDAEKHTGPVLATENDPRITSVGRFIRLTRLDELPQLINVLLGHMSFVGPRPEREFYVKQFQEQMPLYSQRHTVKPGLTGFAQVMGKYSTTVEEKLKYDLMYINNYSILLDIRIIIKTIFVVLKREQAVGISNENELQIEKYIS
ncbi:MAG: hypothetical protein K0S34_898 [Bacillales bacterium]|nr:hypothetical protein [Bacillales bacterium]